MHRQNNTPLMPKREYGSHVTVQPIARSVSAGFPIQSNTFRCSSYRHFLANDIETPPFKSRSHVFNQVPKKYQMNYLKRNKNHQFVSQNIVSRGNFQALYNDYTFTSGTNNRHLSTRPKINNTRRADVSKCTDNSTSETIGRSDSGAVEVENCNVIPAKAIFFNKSQPHAADLLLAKAHDSTQNETNNIDVNKTLPVFPNPNNVIDAENTKTVLKKNNCAKCEEEAECLCNEDTPVKSSREKTPMCLVNDLARFNKISFQYRLTGEKGPAHCKQFTVTLKLGDEEYTAEEFKIKKAQHLAAKEAIQKTRYKHPVPKVNRQNDDHVTLRANVTPTVELNALAMKLGEQTYYIFDSKLTSQSDNKLCASENILQRYRVTQVLGSNGHIRSTRILEHSQLQRNSAGAFGASLGYNPGIYHIQQSSHHHRAKFQQSYPVVVTSGQHQTSTLLPNCKITLIVGTQKFFGVGRTIQQAKHHAAAQAIINLKEKIAGRKEIVIDRCNEIDQKSPISLVFEIGIKRNLPVDFKILREDGPAHMRTFTTACIVGDIVTEGEGTGKKTSKKIAAEKMIAELNKLPPLTPTNSPTKRTKSKTPTKKLLASQYKNNSEAGMEHHNKDKKQTLTKKMMTSQFKYNNDSEIERQIKETKLIPDSDVENPVARLIEWCQHKSYSEPVFMLVSENQKDRSRRGQFVIEVSSQGITARGVGHSKKLARRNASQNFLNAVDPNGKEMMHHSTIAQVKHLELSPNALPAKQTDLSKCVEAGVKEDKQTDTIVANNEFVEATDATSDIDDLKSKTPQKEQKSGLTKIKGSGFNMKDKLLYLARLIGFEVDFSDYPKGNHNEFLTIVMISTNPPQICHGVGVNIEESQEDAASNALKILREMGLNNSLNS